jgi:hypothetical protein
MPRNSVPSDDNVRQVLAEHNISESQVQRVRLALLKWFEGRPPGQPNYLVPQMSPDQEGSPVLTSGDMVNHLRKFSPVARSYVELFIVGGLTNPHIQLEEVLDRLEHGR